MSKHVHKIYFWLVCIVFVMTLTLLYVFNGEKIFGVNTPPGVTIQGDTLLGQDIVAGGQSFSSGSFNWGDDDSGINKELRDKIDKLIGINPCTNGISSNSNYKCTNDIDTVLFDINPDGKPEGQIWYYYGNDDIEIGGANIGGKGTIIIKGNVKISGNITYSGTNSSIGLIVMKKDDGTRGTLEIETSVNSIVGAYYAQKEIIFKYLE